MNNKNTTASSGGLGIGGVLQIIFIVLKLLNLIEWSWWTVFLPTFISLGITIIALSIWLIIIFKDKD